MKKKFNPELLKEEQNRFRLLSEYDFYTEKKEPVTYSEDGGKELLLGKDLEEADENPNDNLGQDDANIDAAADNVAADLGVDNEPTDQTGSQPAPDANATPPAPDSNATPPAPDSNDTSMDTSPDMDDSNAVELDVTDLVQGSDAAKQSADIASRNSELLLQKLSDLEARVANMTNITNKIEDLENEIIKRNPTPVEKLEMRSLDSYPFNQKLSDYWADKEGAYDVMHNEKNTPPKEYTLTRDDVDNSYNEFSAKDSFKVTPDMYDEEDIDGYIETDY